MMDKEGLMNNNQQNELKSISKDCAILTLRPKSAIFEKLKELSSEMIDVSPDVLNKYLDESLLVAHTVPVCMPLLTTPDDLYLFVKDNSKLLIDIMLTAWPFPIESWGFIDKDIDFINQMVDVQYYPFLCKAITKPFDTTLDLSVTFATPTSEFNDYVVERMSSQKMTLSEEKITFLNFIMNTGVAIITNKIEQLEKQSMLEYTVAINDSKSYLTGLGNKMLDTLFYFYFENKADYPEEDDNKFLNKWFNTKTFTGMYLLPSKFFEK